MRVKAAQEPAAPGEKERENQVCVALEREVRVRTDLVKRHQRSKVARSGLGPLH